MFSCQKPDLVIFDCDGVLIDSQVIQCQVDAAELTRLGFPVTAEELSRRFTGTATKDVQAYVEAALGRPLPSDFEATRDRQAAKSAGMPVLGFHGGGHCYPGYEERLIAAGASAVFDSMERLPALLGFS